MGVPKFFRYISERYPCLSEVIKEYQIPEFDNLYLDMNGIIHMCSHPNDYDPHFRITEEQIFKDIFHYIEILFRMIQPQRLFFMAVDGVAPRAKMNQQRGRRFRSAKEAEVVEANAKERGEVLPDVERFDSNCITPGTEFMTKLQEQLKFFVTYKVSTDKLWQKVKVILSGHQVPGEGEHKIMDYIRYLKSQPGYDSNTRHCLYGLDADLIMLGLCTHEPHFSLLREEVKFTGRKSQKRSSIPEDTKFYLLHLSLMREYLDLEFQQLKTTLPFPYDLENIIDDWVLMGFLVGNDFIPNLPDLHIVNGALPILYSAYIDILPSLGGYINEGGTLRLERFQRYMEKLAAFDLDKFKDKFADLKYFESKTGRRPNSKERPSLKPGEDTVKNKDLENLIKETEMLDQGSDDVDHYIPHNEDDDIIDNYLEIDSDEDSTFFAEFSQHKNDYYINKLEYKKVTPEVLRSQAEGYVRAIQWNLNYYYNGCCSWSWFYPHHYAPYISDIKDFANFKLEFEMGKPFLPFQQLLAVLPAASKKLLPVPFQELMVDDDSPIIDFYPSQFKTDMNGKKQEWEAVVLIPFIHQESLIKAMDMKMHRLTDEEIKRNTHGPMQVYSYSSEDLGEYDSPGYFPKILHNHAKVYEMWREELVVDRSNLVKGLCPGVKLDVYFPGFPTLKHIAFTASLISFKVKVFDQPSRGDNMILRITPQGNPNISEVAAQLIGKTIFVNWPHMIEAKVVAVANKTTRYVMGQAGSGSNLSVEQMNHSSQVQWISSKQGIEDRYIIRMGIDIGKTQILVYCCNMEGRKYLFGRTGKISLEKQWCKTPTAYALQTTVRDIAVNDPTFVQYRTLEEVFPVNTICFLLGPPLYGTMGKVTECGTNGRVSIEAEVSTEPDLIHLKQSERETRTHYMPVNAIIQKLGIGTNLFLRITGTIYLTTADSVEQGFTENLPKVNVGLNLKFNKKNEEVCGYTRRDNGYWLYSTRTLDLVKEYINKFPELFEYLGCNYHNNDIFSVKTVFPENSAERLKELTTWLKEQPAAKAERQTCGAQVLEEELVQSIEDTVDAFNGTKQHTNIITMQVKPHLLYLPKIHLGMLSPDPNAVHHLFDRIINVRDCYTVPLGLKGTIIGIHGAEKETDTVYDVVFDKQFVGGVKLRCSEYRGYKMTCQSFINLTYGMKQDRTKTQAKPTAVVQPSGPTDSTDSMKQFGYNSAFASWRNKPQSYQPDVNKKDEEKSPFLKALEKKMTPPPPAPAPPKLQPQSSVRPKSATNPSSSEFQAMQNELQKSGSSQTQKLPVTAGPSQEPQVDVLKKILKIADDIQPKLNLQQPELPTTVEVRWQKSAPPVMPAESGLSYCLQLINYFQQSATFGVPYYRYDQTPEGCIATVCLPKGGMYTGAPAPGKEQAAENAAQVAIKHLMGEQNPRPVLQAPTQMYRPNAVASVTAAAAGAVAAAAAAATATATANCRPPLLMTPPQQFNHGFNRLPTPSPSATSWLEPAPHQMPTPRPSATGWLEPAPHQMPTPRPSATSWREPGPHPMPVPRPSATSWQEPGPHQVPTPPQQWCQQNIFKPENMPLNWHQGVSNSPMLMTQNHSTPANPFFLPLRPQIPQNSPNWHPLINNPFVPLQADKMMYQVQSGTQEKPSDIQQVTQFQPVVSVRQKEAAFPAPNNNQSGRDDRPRRLHGKPKSRIAAKFSVPLEDIN